MLDMFMVSFSKQLLYETISYKTFSWEIRAIKYITNFSVDFM